MGVRAAPEAGAGVSDDPMQAVDAEVSLLGAAMSGYPDLDELAAIVEPEDFYPPFHEEVWAAILRVHRAGNQPDPVSVRLALSAADVRHDPTRLHDFQQACVMPANAPYYAEQVATAAGLRRIQAAGVKVQSLGATHGDLDEIREQARQAVDDACHGKTVSKAKRIADLLTGALDAAQSGTSAVLPTGWPDIDRAIGGIAPGRLIVFGARPGGGKSIAGTNLALHVAHHHGHAALLASLEMPESEVMNRLLAAHARVDLTRLTNSAVEEAEWEKIAAKHAELDAMPLYLDDTSNLSVQGLRRLARDVQRERDDLALIVVDYLQLMKPAQHRRDASRAEEVSQIARDLKLLARETGACVVAMAQVNREGGKAADGPRLVDIREGGAENDADVVILLHRPNIETPEVTATVAKNRHGPANAVATLQMIGHYARLGNSAWSPSRAVSA